MDICPAEIATLPRSTTPKGCLPNSPGSTPRDGPAYRGDAWAQATAAQSETTAHRSIAQIDACSSFQ